MATIGIRTLLIVATAGYSGTYIYNNLDHARALATRLLLQPPTTDQSNSPSQPSPQTEALSAQMDALTRQMSRANDNPVVLLGPTTGSLKGSLATLSDLLNLLGWGLVVVSLGGVGYYVAVRRNLSLRDLAWVSQSTFNGTIAAMQKGITRVSGAVGAVRRDLGERLRLMEGRVDSVRECLSEKIEEEVAGVKGGVDNVGAEVCEVRGVLDNVHSRIEQLDGKIDTATTGIMALARVVSSLAPERLQPGTPFYELKRFADAKNIPEIATSQPGLRQRLSNGGLRGLLVGALGRDDGETVDDVGDGRCDSVGKGNGPWNKVRENEEEPLPWEA